jgi:hypothetical protein
MESRRFPFKIKFRLKIKCIGKISIKDVSSAKNNRPQAGFVRVNKAVKKNTEYKEVLATEFLPSVLQIEIHNTTCGFMGYS